MPNYYLNTTPQFLYTTRSRFRSFGIHLGQAVVDDHDPRIDRAVASVSRMLTALTKRVFLPYVATKKFDFQNSRRLVFNDDLLELNTLVDYGGTLASDQYILYPLNAEIFKQPYTHLEMLSPYYMSYGPDKQSSILVTGKWGYCEFLFNYGTVLKTDIDESVTSISFDDSIPVEPGSLLYLDTEQVLITAFDTDTLTAVVVRGFNGTTAAAHTALACVVQTIHPDPEIEELVCMLASRHLARGLNAYSDRAGDPSQGFTYFKALPAEAQHTIKRLQRKAYYWPTL